MWLMQTLFALSEKLSNVNVQGSEGSRQSQQFISASMRKLRNLEDQWINASAEEGKSIGVTVDTILSHKALVKQCRSISARCNGDAEKK